MKNKTPSAMIDKSHLKKRTLKYFEREYKRAKRDFSDPTVSDTDKLANRIFLYGIIDLAFNLDLLTNEEFKLKRLKVSANLM